MVGSHIPCAACRPRYRRSGANGLNYCVHRLLRANQVCVLHGVSGRPHGRQVRARSHGYSRTACRRKWNRLRSRESSRRCLCIRHSQVVGNHDGTCRRASRRIGVGGTDAKVILRIKSFGPKYLPRALGHYWPDVQNRDRLLVQYPLLDQGDFATLFEQQTHAILTMESGALSSFEGVFQGSYHADCCFLLACFSVARIRYGTRMCHQSRISGKYGKQL